MAHDPPFVAVLRVILLAMLSDGQLDEQERRWLNRLVKRHGLTSDERNRLEADLARPPDLRDLLRDLTSTERDRLLAFVDTAISVDQKLESSEIEFRGRVQHVLDQIHRRASAGPSLNDAYASLAGELVKFTNRKLMWQRLIQQGRRRTRRWLGLTSLWNIFRHF